MKMLKIHMEIVSTMLLAKSLISSLFILNIVLVSFEYTYPRQYPKFFISLPRRVFITGHSPQKCNIPVFLFIVVYIWHRGRNWYAFAQEGYSDLDSQTGNGILRHFNKTRFSFFQPLRPRLALKLAKSANRSINIGIIKRQI